MQYYNPNSLKKASPMRTPQFNRIGNLTNEQLVGADAGTIARNATQQRAKFLQDYSQQDNPALQQSFGNLYDYMNQYTAGLGGLQDQNLSNIDTQSQKGLSNLLSQYAKANAGTGRLGGSAYARGQGDLFDRAASQYSQAALAERNAGAARAGTLANALMSTQQAEDYRPRWLSGELATLGNDSVRNYMATQPAAAPEEPSFLQQIAPIAGMAAGAYFGGPAGAMIGGQLGGMAAGSPQQQNQSGLQNALMMAALQQGQAGDRTTAIPAQSNVSPLIQQEGFGYGVPYTSNDYGGGMLEAGAANQAAGGAEYYAGNPYGQNRLGYQQFDPNLMVGW